MGYRVVGRESRRFWEEVVFFQIMKWLTLSWLVGRVRGVEIRFHFSILFSVIITYLLFRPVSLRAGLLALLWLVGFVLSVFLHELGHALAAKLVRVEVKSIVIWLLGGFTNLSREAEKPIHRLAIYAAGPFVTILLGGLCIVAYSYTPFNPLILWIYVSKSLFLSLAIVNLSLFVVNILPVFPLDGGNILHALMELLFGKSNANLITMIVSIPVLLCLIGFGIFTRDYILLAFCILIALAIGTLNHQTQHWINLGLSYLFKRAGYYYLQGDYDCAVQYYTRDIEREPQQVNHYIGRAYCYLLMLQKERALADVERAVMIAPNNVMAMQLRGDIYAIEKNYDAALEIFENVHKINSRSGFPPFSRGSVFLDKKEFKSALEELDKAISLSTQVPLFYVIRSMAHFRLGNLEAAHKDQDSALRLSEKDALTMADINMQVYENYLDWCEDYYARVLLKRPRSRYAFQGRADAYRMNGEHNKAITDYTRALELNPREPRLFLGRGKSYQAIQDIGCAGVDFRQVLVVTDKIHLRRQAEDLLESLNGK
jgi:tetratricopeptide (TPR) repeat protein/Zn-dependent protease